MPLMVEQPPKGIETLLDAAVSELVAHERRGFSVGDRSDEPPIPQGRGNNRRNFPAQASGPRVFRCGDSAAGRLPWAPAPGSPAATRRRRRSPPAP
jgi:hypothetical protein